MVFIGNIIGVLAPCGVWYRIDEHLSLSLMDVEKENFGLDN
jgi:hypothetical protein